MEKQDMHVHTRFSSDSDAVMRESVCVAVERGLSAVAFTEHMDLSYPKGAKELFRSEMSPESLEAHPDFDELELFTFNPDRYFKEIEEVRKEFGNKIRIISGMEMGLRPGRPDLVREYKRLLKEYPFEFTLGSVHLLYEADPYFPRFWEGKDPDTVVRDYFRTILECVKEYDFFDSLGHIDYALRYVPADKIDVSKAEYFERAYSSNKETVDSILRILIDRKQALEINTRGIFTELKHVHPSEAILTRYKELGGTLFTTGSDAHYSEKVGDGIDGI